MNSIVLKSNIPLGEIYPNIGIMLRERKEKFFNNFVLQEKREGKFQKYKWYEFYHEISIVGTSLIEMGIKKGDKIAVLSRNRKEMLVLELAVMSIGAISVPIFSEYPAFQIDYILSHSDSKFLVVCDRPHLNEALKTKAIESIDKIFVMEWKPYYGHKHKNISDFKILYDFKRDTSEFENRIEMVDQEDPCLIMYTSGTTGMPKGVVLCHRNILSQQKALSLLWNVGPGDRFLSYLPWHHSFGGLFERFTAICSGATLTIDESYGKDIPLLLKNFRAVKPTVYFSVPKIYQVLVTEAMNSKEIEKEIIHPELKFVFTAAAPLPEDISEYFKKKKISIVEGWGLTETSPCATLTPLSGERYPHTVGFAIPGVEVKISDEGEILVRGPNVMLGYYKEPAKTSQVIEDSGWFHTGDLGEISEKGLVIKGRMDGVFKLLNAEKVSSQIVETAIISSSDYIDNAVVLGEGKDFVSALIFPNFKNLENWAQKNKISVSSKKALLKNQLVRELFQNEISNANKKISPKFARVKAFALIDRELNLKKAELTPSLKIVRSKVIENFSNLVKAIYHPGEVDLKYKKEVIFLEKEEYPGAMKL
ncbi:MAG: AMP-binding protein [Acidobacteriota bacterium]